MLQFICAVVKDTGKEKYLRPFVRIGSDWTVGLNNCYYTCLVRTTVSGSGQHSINHFICPIIQQYTHLHGYGLEEQDSKVR